MHNSCQFDSALKNNALRHLKIIISINSGLLSLDMANECRPLTEYDGFLRMGHLYGVGQLFQYTQGNPRLNKDKCPCNARMKFLKCLHCIKYHGVTLVAWYLFLRLEQ
jgi:hypothetical protein